MLVFNARDRAFLSYHAWFDHIAGSLLFRFSVKILDELKYSDLYKLAHCMATDPVLIIMMIYRGSEVDLEKTAVRYGFVSYNPYCCGLRFCGGVGAGEKCVE